MDCIFSAPLDFEGNVPVEKEPFAFSVMTCTDNNFSIITNEITGASFSVDKTLSYGDILILIFIILFFGYGVFRFCWNFVFKDYPSKI